MPPVSLSASYTPTARPPAAGPPSEIGATRFDTMISRLMKRDSRYGALGALSGAAWRSCPARRRDNRFDPVEQRGDRFDARMRHRLAHSDLNRQAAALVDDGKAFLIGQIVAGEHREAADERRLVEERAHRAALVDVLRLDFIDHLAGLQHV